MCSAILQAVRVLDWITRCGKLPFPKVYSPSSSLSSVDWTPIEPPHQLVGHCCEL